MGFYVTDLLLTLASQAAFFAAGWVFFVRKISGEYRVQSRLVLALFAATFSLSCSLFELIIFEILDILNRSMRWMLWKLSLVGMLTMVIIVIPMCQIRMLVIGKNRGECNRQSGAVMRVVARAMLREASLGTLFTDPARTCLGRLAQKEWPLADLCLLGGVHLGLLEGGRALSHPQQGAR